MQVLLTLLVAGIALAVLLLALLVLLHLRARRRRARPWPPWPPLQPGLPVVLAHGVLGFDEMRLADERVEYFRGVADLLQHLGVEVHRPRVSSMASVADRAAQLADYVRQIPRPVNLVAHSMGGLDARFAISRLGLAGRVASLTTIGSPHRGTPLADVGAVVLRRLGILRLLGFFGLDLTAFADLSRAHTKQLNQELPDADGVAYFSVVGVAPGGGRVHPLLLATHLYLQQHGGPNDGLVPRDSQVWGEILAELAADHFAQIGWSRHFNAGVLYRDLVRELRHRGL